MRRCLLQVSSLALVTLVTGAALARPAAADQLDQLFSANIGYFAVRGEDARVSQDVLNENRSFLAFNLKDFNNASVGGDWLVAVGEFIEAGVGLGYYRRTVPSIYEAFVNRDGSEIEQDLKLRIVPITATVRVLPLGRHGAIQPYLGGGVGFYTWRYSEAGEFVDFRDSTIFRDRFVADGTDSGPVILGGVRVPIGSRFATGAEIRYQRARGTLDERFAGEKIDLGGYSYSWTAQAKF